MIDEPIHVTDATYERAVLQSELPVIVDFWAPWCGPCKVIGPMLEDAAKKYAGKLIIAKINIDDDSETAESLGVQSIPSLFFIKNGEIVNRSVGAKPAAALDEMIQDFIS
ncbi:MAG: thioredoxin [Anaerolineaceae bacterium]|nr:thioredoxin [Anaerolineaceae bacterium]